MTDCRECLKSSLIVHFLVLMFGAGAWIAVNGVWVELPLIVSSAPESWNLPSYLTVIAQVANVGPVLVTLMQALCPKYFHQNVMIYIILVIGTASCLLLSFFWDAVASVQGQLHSIALFVLWFALAFVDCTSSVTFLPFMTTFQTIFLTTYFVGEGLSGFLPSIFALIQGVQSEVCRNVTHFNATTNTTSYHIETEYLPPRYSVDVFFVLLCIMMLACGISFTLLNYLGVARKFYAPIETCSEEDDEDGSRRLNTSLEMRSSGGSSDTNPPVVETEHIIKTIPASSDNLISKPKLEKLSKQEYVYLLAIIFFINAASNGVLPSVSSYSSLPYGSFVYHLSACLGNMANPLACFIAVFLPMHSLMGLGVFTLLSTGCGCYLMILAVQSPCPILVNADAGKALMILAQVFYVGIVSFIKVSIAQIFRIRGHEKSLVWYGGVVQAGSLVGALTMFPLVNVYYFFTNGDLCTTICP